MKEIATLQYPSCTNELPLVSNVRITECGDLKEHKISVSAVLDTSSVQKGCERSHDPVTSIYSQCGFNEVIELLPNTSPGWMEDTATEETIQGFHSVRLLCLVFVNTYYTKWSYLIMINVNTYYTKWSYLINM